VGAPPVPASSPDPPRRSEFSSSGCTAFPIQISKRFTKVAADPKLKLTDPRLNYRHGKTAETNTP
jgi:hypothetical protein